MITTAKSNRLQIGVFGRTNVGKSSFVNVIAGQDVAITSPLPGTTTDVVEKSMELLPIGPVVFLDTAGLDDSSSLGNQRTKRAIRIFDRADIFVLVIEANTWTACEERVVAESIKRQAPLIIILNKTDITEADFHYRELLGTKSKNIIICSCSNLKEHETCRNIFKEKLLKVCPLSFFSQSPIIRDLVPRGGLAILITPIDSQAPRGRLILPQVQCLRDLLDGHALGMVVREDEYVNALGRLTQPPDIVVCDSQVVDLMVKSTPPSIPCTTFSILFARLKGDLKCLVDGVHTIDLLRFGDRVLIAEACSHHPLADDIGRIKIPRWLQERITVKVSIDTCAGRDYPENLSDYRLIIHCGACMLTRREMLNRIEQAHEHGVAITNYGICIAFLHDVLHRVLAPYKNLEASQCTI